MAAIWEIIRTVELQDDAPGVERLQALASTSSRAAHRLRIRPTQGGKPADLDGCKVSLSLILPDARSVYAEDGEIADGEARCDIPLIAYGRAGEVRGMMHLTGDGWKLPLFAFILIVRADLTDSIEDPGNVIPSIAELLAEIDAMRKATSAASDATGAANTAAGRIENLTAEAHSVASGGPTVKIEKREDGYHIILGIEKGEPGEQGKPGERGEPGAQGPRGEQGAPFLIKGEAFPSVEALQAAVQDPAEGDQYNVGTEAPYNIYRWTGSAWEDQGQLQGPPGKDGKDGQDGHDGKDGQNGQDGAPGANGTNGTNGKDGKDGATFTPNVSAEGILTWTNDKGLDNPPQADIRGPQGEPGKAASVPFSSDAPKPLGNAAAGVSDMVARADHVHPRPSAEDIGAVPTSRTINGKPLTGNVTLTAQDLNATRAQTGQNLSFRAGSSGYSKYLDVYLDGTMLGTIYFTND